MLAPIFFFLAFFYGYPTLSNLYNSFTDLSLLGLKKGGEFVGLRNYVELLSSRDFYRVFWNTLFWLTAVSVALRLVLGLALALLLNSVTLRRWRLATVSRLLLLVPWATPPIVAVVVWRWLLDGRQGFVNGALQGLGLIDRPHRVSRQRRRGLAGDRHHHRLEHAAARDAHLPCRPPIGTAGARGSGRDGRRRARCNASSTSLFRT